ncbi:hypothetical protein AB1N83_008865, partial [Pleurotus pulmonarius]
QTFGESFYEEESFGRESERA